MQLADILKMYGIKARDTRIVRHTTNRKEIREIVELGLFDLYQSYQKTKVFRDSKYIITFIATEGKNAILHGLYTVKQVEKTDTLPLELHPIMNIENWGSGPYYKYELERDYLLEDLEERLVIDWGGSTISWCQKKVDKEVVTILEKGSVNAFLGYEKVLLDFEELEKMIKHPDVNKQWKSNLSNIYAVYLILDTKTGQQYIGSAYGKEGLWGRWRNYVQTKHGGNRVLIELLNNDPLRYKKFRFSILNILPNSALKEEIIELEQLVKEKLGTRVFGLNLN